MTLENIEENHTASLTGDSKPYSTKTLLTRGKKRYGRGLTEDAEGCLNANNLRPSELKRIN